MKYNSRKIFVLSCGFLVVAIVVRIQLFPMVFSDFTQFLDQWINTLRVYGPGVIRAGFSNYTTPYLLLLWIGGRIFWSNLMVVKMIALGFDCVAALGVYKIVTHYRPEKHIGFLAASLYLILPTIVYNSAAWGQCDSLLGAMTIWAFWFCLKDRLNFSWILIGICFATKMQGIFFAPFLFAVALNRKKTIVTGPLLAIAAFLVFTCPTLLAGDTISRIASVFLSGVGAMFGERHLSWWMANLAQWFPNAYYDQFRVLGIVLALVFVAFLVYTGLKRKRLGDESLLILAALTLIMIPFVLPQMHGRYYYQGETLLFALAFVRYQPARIWILVLMEAVSMLTFILALQYSLPQMHLAFKLLSLGVAAVLLLLAREWSRSGRKTGEVDAGCRNDLRVR